LNDKTNQLIVIEPAKVYDVFTTPNGVAALLEQINADALAIVPDLSTDKSRKAIASVAYKVSQTKSYLDGLGKEVTDKLKELPKTVDANRKHLRDTLDALRDTVRKPLTDWEVEQARLEAERVAKVAAEKLAAEIEHAHEIGLLMNTEFDRKQAEEKAEAERIQKARDQAIAEAAATAAREAAEKAAKAQAEAVERQAAAERERVERERLAAIAAAEKAESDRRAAEERHARELADREAKAKQDAARAVAAERERAESEQRRIKAEEDAKKAAEAKAAENKEHQRKINSAIVADLTSQAGLTVDQAKAVVKAVLSGSVANVSIKY